MRRILLIGFGGYLTAAAISHVWERAGLSSCECRSDCWCQRPGLSLFRWVFPFGHNGDC
jgi:hypothetical protein